MKRVILFLLIFVVLSFANRIIAKDSTPGGIYIIGPDVSPDSSSHAILYYSPDGGYTLEIRDTLDCIEADYIAVDFDDSIVYIHSIIPPRRFSVSFDGGQTWEVHDSPIGYDNIKAGVYPGRISASVWVSEDYGFSWINHSGIGWSGGWAFDYEQGIGNIFYIESNSGILHISYDLCETLSVVCTLDVPIFLVRGVFEGELYGIQNYHIIYSSDSGFHWDTTGLTPYFSIDTLGLGDWEIVQGFYPGELFLVSTVYNWDYYWGIRGGIIEFWKSVDYGYTWELIARHEAGISESNITKRNKIEIYPNPFTEFINSNELITIIDISGREIASGQGKISLSNFPPGLYFAIARIDNKQISRKILKIQ